MAANFWKGCGAYSVHTQHAHNETTSDRGNGFGELFCAQMGRAGGGYFTTMLI